MGKTTTSTKGSDAGPSKLKDKSKSKPKAKSDADAASIDDIFAAPKAAKRKAEVEGVKEKLSRDKVSNKPGVSGGEPVSTEQKKKKKKKQASTTGTEAGPGSTKQSEPVTTVTAVEEVVDPSQLPKATKVKSVEAKKVTSKVAAGKKSQKDVEEDEMFADSRGEGPRRKTEEGFLIYKEAELQIDPEAGGTPLCPFDCDCCF
ncbi:hypothetical protein IAU60_004470 [Kwoniella sp. DSM 27419]